MYMYVNVYVCMYLFIYMYEHMHLWIPTADPRPTRVYMYVNVYVCMYLYICMNICICRFLLPLGACFKSYVCMYVFVYACTATSMCLEGVSVVNIAVHTLPKHALKHE